MSPTYYVPIAKAIALHLVILALFSSSWTPEKDEQFVPPVVIVKARILSMNDPILARQKREQDKLKAQQRAKDRAREAERKQAEKRKADKKRKDEDLKKKDQQRKLAERKKADNKRKTDELRKQEDAKRLAAENKKRRELEALQARESEMANALAEESELMQEDSDLQAVQSYVGLIQARIIENWHRPLSARNGMKTLLVIHLVPTGEVQNVYVAESSGDSAFDRSALQAVQRAEKFAELQALDPRAFDKHFRTFRMLFKPQDLDR